MQLSSYKLRCKSIIYNSNYLYLYWIIACNNLYFYRN